MTIRSLLCPTLALLLFCGSASGQNPQTDKIRDQIGRIGVLGNITVSLISGAEYYGTVSRIAGADFAVNDVDQRREITSSYADVRKVRQGYGTTRNIRGQRIHPRTKLIVSLAVIGGLLALVFIAVASEKS